MGCLRAIFYQIGCLVLLVAAAVAAFIYRRQIADYYHDWRAGRAAGRVWALPVEGGADEAARRLEQLADRRGRAYVDLTAGDIAALLDAELGRGARRAFDSVAVSLDSNDVRVRGVVDLSDVPRDLLGPLRGVVGGRQQVTVGGPLEADSAGRLLWRIRTLRIGDVPLPRGAVVPTLRAARVPGIVDGRVPLPVRAAVGDVRVTTTGVRLYRK
jgi:hypothetical protein